MKLSIKKLLGLLAVAAIALPSVVFAQAATSDLESQVKELTKKVAALESAKGSMSSSSYVMPTEGDVKKGGLLHAAQDIDFGGYVATTYTDNFQKSARQGRVYDANQGFALNQADLYFKKDARP